MVHHGDEAPRQGRDKITWILIAIGVVLALVIIVVSFSSNGRNDNDAPLVPPTAPPTTLVPTVTSTVVASPTAVALGDSWTMPDLRGGILQQAQDKLQQVTGNPGYASASHDLLGDRNQVVDANWKVCTQNVKPGAKFGQDDKIDFGVVKVSEDCP